MLGPGFRPFTENVDLSQWLSAPDIFGSIVQRAQGWRKVAVVDVLNAGLPSPRSTQELEQLALRVATPSALCVLVDRASEQYKTSEGTVTRFVAPRWLPGRLSHALPENVVYVTAFAPHVVKLSGDSRCFDLTTGKALHGQCEIDDYVVTVLLALLDRHRRPGQEVAVGTQEQRILKSPTPPKTTTGFYVVAVLGSQSYYRDIDPGEMTSLLATLTNGTWLGPVTKDSSLSASSRSSPARASLSRIASSLEGGAAAAAPAERVALATPAEPAEALDLQLPRDLHTIGDVEVRKAWARAFCQRFPGMRQEAAVKALKGALGERSVDVSTKTGADLVSKLGQALEREPGCLQKRPGGPARRRRGLQP